jgi:hypothetical protein
MDTKSFDGLTRSFATGRRGALKAVAGAALGAVGIATIAKQEAKAACIHKFNACEGSTPERRDRNCCSGCCRGGICRAARACS